MAGKKETPRWREPRWSRAPRKFACRRFLAHILTRPTRCVAACISAKNGVTLSVQSTSPTFLSSVPGPWTVCPSCSSCAWRTASQTVRDRCPLCSVRNNCRQMVAVQGRTERSEGSPYGTQGSSRVEPACPKASPIGRTETTTGNLTSTFSTSASNIQQKIHVR